MVYQIHQLTFYWQLVRICDQILERNEDKTLLQAEEKETSHNIIYYMHEIKP